MQYLVLAVFVGVALAVGIAIINGASKIVVLATLALVALTLLIRSPPMLIAAVVLTQITRLSIISSINLTAFKVGLMGLLLFTIVHAAQKRRVFVSPKHFFVVMGAMFLMRAMSNLLAGAIGWAPNLLQMVSSFALVAIAAQFIHTVDDHRTMLKPYIAMVLLCGVWVFFETPPTMLSEGGNVRAIGPAGSPNSTGSISSFLFFLAFPIALDKQMNLKWRVAALAMIPALFYVQFATSSRGVMVATIIALLMFGNFFQTTTKQRMTAFATILVGALCFVAIAPKSFLFRMESTVKTSEVSDSIEFEDSSRLELAELAFEMIREKPLVGHGDNSFQQRSQFIFDGQAVVSHTAYLGVATAYGLPFALLWTLTMLGSLLAAMWLCHTSRGEVRPYYAGMVGSLSFKVIFSISAVETFDQISWLQIGLTYHYLQQELQRRRQKADRTRPHALLQPSASTSVETGARPATH